MNATNNYAVYVDGVLQTATTIANLNGPLFNSSANLTIGAPNNASGGTFNGRLDELAIYNRALSPEEIKQLATVPEPRTIMLFVLGVVGAAVYFSTTRQLAVRAIALRYVVLFGAWHTPLLTHADVVVTGYLEGNTPLEITDLGEYNNSGFAIIGAYETYAKITYDGLWKTGIKTSVVWDGFFGGPFPAEASARVVVNREGQAFGPALPSEIIIQGVLHGTVVIQGAGENSFHDGALTIGNRSVVLETQELLFIGNGFYDVGRPFLVSVPVNPTTGSFPANFWFKSESYADEGLIISDLSTTLEITAITLPNGMTPESAGLTLTFSDGVPSPNILPGDFNGNGSVDAADYAAWRDSIGTSIEYNLWRANFGRTAGNGAETSFDAAKTTVPELSSMPSALIAMFAVTVAVRIRRS
jgi:hypothetical protein